MSLIRRPDLHNLSNKLEDFFNKDWFDFGALGTSMPAVNIKDDETEYRIEVAAPGMKKEDFNIKLDHNVLSISSEIKEETEEKDEEGKYTRREFKYSSFQRSFTLPDTTDVEKIAASYKDGILNITVPKKEEAKQNPPRKIDIS